MSDFDKYIRQGEPERKEKAHARQAAIGLQDVDGLKPSEYLQQTAGRHIYKTNGLKKLIKHLPEGLNSTKIDVWRIEN